MFSQFSAIVASSPTFVTGRMPGGFAHWSLWSPAGQRASPALDSEGQTPPMCVGSRRSAEVCPMGLPSADGRPDEHSIRSEPITAPAVHR